MAEEPEQALDEMADDTRVAREGIEAELKQDIDKAKGDGSAPKRPWWKVWGSGLAEVSVIEADGVASGL